MKSVKSFLCRPTGGSVRGAHPSAFRMGALLTIFVLLAATTRGAFSQGGLVDAGQSPSVVWNLQYVDAPPFFYNMTDRSLAWRPDGVPCTAYGSDRLTYACYNLGTNTWTRTVVDGGLGVGGYAALAFNSFSWPFISYYDATNRQLKLAYNDGAGWQIFVVESPPLSPDAAPELSPNSAAPDDQGPSFLNKVKELLQPWLGKMDTNNVFDSIGIGKYTSIDIDYLNRVHISYHDEIRGSLKYAYWDGTLVGGNPLFNITELDDYNDQGDVGLWTSIITDSNLNVHISYMSEKYDDLKYAFRRYSNGTWTIMTVDGEDNIDMGSCTSIALDSDGLPHISYLDFTHGRLKHAWLGQLGNGFPWHSESVDSDGNVGWYTSIVIDGHDKVHISYYDATDKDLKYTYYQSNSWHTSRVRNDGNVGMFSSIVIGINTQPNIAYYDATLGRWQFVYRTGQGSWISAADIDTNSRDVGQSTSLAVTSSGVPMISYLNGSAGYLKFAVGFGSGWNTSTVLNSPHAGAYNSLKLTSDSSPRIAFYDSDEGDLMYAIPVSGGWQFQDVDRTYDVGQYVSLALDGSNTPHISYYDATYHDLLYAYWNVSTSRWVTRTLDYVGDVGKYTSIAIDATNRPSISYYDETNGRLKRAFMTILNAWVFQVVDDPPLTPPDSDVGKFTSLAFDPTGEAHISYYDVINGNLKYASISAGVWTTMDLDNSANNVGLYSSLTINVATGRHICYYDATAGDLKYANYLGGIWTISQVDTEGDVGAYCSMAVDSAGQPAISYYDNSRGDLKIALGFLLPATTPYYLPLVNR